MTKPALNYQELHTSGQSADYVARETKRVEMWLANLSAAGETLREIFKQRPA
jgi:hypothetical protein